MQDVRVPLINLGVFLAILAAGFLLTGSLLVALFFALGCSILSDVIQGRAAA
ncbi:MAG: hypothetical protein HKN78_10110 [Sphingomonadaceae bacterium]|nr:hypothetical protein [Sphingomonadaceae bacterium]